MMCYTVILFGTDSAVSSPRNNAVTARINKHQKWKKRERKCCNGKVCIRFITQGNKTASLRNRGWHSNDKLVHIIVEKENRNSKWNLINHPALRDIHQYLYDQNFHLLLSKLLDCLTLIIMSLTCLTQSVYSDWPETSLSEQYFIEGQ